MRLDLGDVVLQVQDRGPRDGAAVVLLHYFGGSSESWSAVIDQLDSRCRCIAPDLRGFGASDAPATGYTVGDYADDVAGLIGLMGLARYTLVGHSMGGKIALALAARRPPGLDALLLLAPSPPTPEPFAAGERIRQVASHGDRAAARVSAQAVAGRTLSDGTLDRFAEDSVRSSPVAWRAWLEHGSREDLSAGMGDVAVAAVVAAGAADPHLSPELLEREVVRRIAGSHLEVVPGVGHLFPLEAPEVVARLIQASACNNPRPGS